MASAEEHNRMRGPALAVLIMDLLRSGPSADTAPISMWDLNRNLCDGAALPRGKAREYQYSRVRRMVGTLERAGLLRSEKQWEADNARYIKLLWPCSTR